MKLYINDKLADLYANTVIAKTLQVNDIAELDKRNSNYTSTFKLPKTGNNLAILDNLTMLGNSSRVPYVQNRVKLFDDNGQCIVHSGWLFITDGVDSFDVNIIDGIKDFYKGIENLNLGAIGIDEIRHDKTVAEVKSTWTEDKPYRYILADYNGNTGNVNVETGVTPEVNIDYLVPSIKVSYLWSKIFQWLRSNVAPDFQYKGIVFDTLDFQELFITYPKGVSVSEENDHVVFNSADFSPVSSQFSTRHIAKWNSSTVNELQSLVNGMHMKVNQSGTYRVDIKGNLKGFQNKDRGLPQDARIYISKNRDAVTVPNNNNVDQFLPIQDNIPHGEDFEWPSVAFDLQPEDSICIVIARATDGEGALNFLPGDVQELEVSFVRIDPTNYDFASALADFTVKDFVKEIVQRFGLTIYRDDASQTYTFMTLAEQLSSAYTVDWSDKFAAKLDEVWRYGSYAKQNNFRYSYNDKEGSHNDYYISIDNVNLEESRDIIKSKIYSPELQNAGSIYLNECSNVYKFWDKEIIEDPEPGQWPVKYNALDKRYYMLRSVVRSGNINVISKDFNTSTPANTYYRETFYRLSFQDIIEDYYASLRQVLNDSIIYNVSLYLSKDDIANFDFKKLYYLKQLGCYCMMNKIINFVPGRPVKCELVRVVFDKLAVPPQSIRITKVITNGLNITVHYDFAVAVPWVRLEYSTNNVSWGFINVPYDNNPVSYALSPGTNYIRIKAGTDYSNTVQITLPSNKTITI